MGIGYRIVVIKFLASVSRAIDIEHGTRLVLPACAVVGIFGVGTVLVARANEAAIAIIKIVDFKMVCCFGARVALSAEDPAEVVVMGFGPVVTIGGGGGDVCGIAVAGNRSCVRNPRYPSDK